MREILNASDLSIEVKSKLALVLIRKAGKELILDNKLIQLQSCMTLTDMRLTEFMGLTEKRLRGSSLFSK